MGFWKRRKAWKIRAKPNLENRKHDEPLAPPATPHSMRGMMLKNKDKEELMEREFYNETNYSQKQNFDSTLMCDSVVSNNDLSHRQASMITSSRSKQLQHEESMDERDGESQDFKDNYVESFRDGEDDNNSYGYSESASFGLEYTHEIPREKRLEFNEFDLRSEYSGSSSSESSYDWEESRCCGMEL